MQNEPKQEQKQEQRKVPGLLEQRIFASQKEGEIQDAVNNFIVEATKSRWQITNISHLTWQKKLVAVISFIRPLKKEEMPEESEVKEL